MTSLVNQFECFHWNCSLTCVQYIAPIIESHKNNNLDFLALHILKKKEQSSLKSEKNGSYTNKSAYWPWCLETHCALHLRTDDVWTVAIVMMFPSVLWILVNLSVLIPLLELIETVILIRMFINRNVAKTRMVAVMVIWIFGWLKKMVSEYSMVQYNNYYVVFIIVINDLTGLASL